MLTFKQTCFSGSISDVYKCRPFTGISLFVMLTIYLWCLVCPCYFFISYFYFYYLFIIFSQIQMEYVFVYPKTLLNNILLARQQPVFYDPEVFGLSYLNCSVHFPSFMYSIPKKINKTIFFISDENCEFYKVQKKCFMKNWKKLIFEITMFLPTHYFCNKIPVPIVFQSFN